MAPIVVAPPQKAGPGSTVGSISGQARPVARPSLGGGSSSEQRR